VAYSTSKFALRGFSEALARELANTKVSVGHFSARATDTPLNNETVVALNKATKTQTDSPDYVAADIVKFIHSTRFLNRLQWPEKLFVRMNYIVPNLVSKSLRKQLPIIEQFAKS
jgi:short-subunit dehydrogenase